MVKDSIKHHTDKPSALDKLSLAFEYDVTWQEAKKAVRDRGDKDIK